MTVDYASLPFYIYLKEYKPINLLFIQQYLKGIDTSFY